MDFANILKEAGPYTAPLCGAMGIAIRWLLLDRKELLILLADARQRERYTSEKRTQELLRSAVAMGESAQVTEKALAGHEAFLRETLRRWDSDNL